MAYICPPRPCFLDTLQKYIVSGGIQIYRGDDKYYTWDGLHGEIEVGRLSSKCNTKKCFKRRKPAQTFFWSQVNR